MIATLPMYDRPQTRPALSRFWALVRDGLRARGISAPDTLDHDAHFMQAWGRDDLVLSQICNLPYRVKYRDRLTVIGAANYGVEGVPEGYYRSVWVVRQDDPAQKVEDCAGYRFAFNDALSQSGWGSPEADAKARGLSLTPHLETGAHAISMAAVSDGGADLAAIDAVTFELARRWDPVVRNLRVIGHTFPTPRMTFVTAKDRDPAPYFEALSAAIAGLSPEDQQCLCLQSILRLPEEAYALPMVPAPWPSVVEA